jgi:hypothetical protein
MFKKLLIISTLLLPITAYAVVNFDSIKVTGVAGKGVAAFNASKILGVKQCADGEILQYTSLESNGVACVATPTGGITQLTGDVTAGPGSGSQAATIANSAVTNAKMANMAQATVKGRASGAGTGAPTDLSDSQVASILDPYFVDHTTNEVVGGVKTLSDEPLLKKGADFEDAGAGTNRVRVRGGTGTANWDLILPTVFPSSDTMVLGITSLDSINNYAYTSFETPSGGGGGGDYEFYGSAHWAGTSNCRWSTSSGTLANYAVDSDCPTPTVTGTASAPGTKIPAITFANIAAGKYKITVMGHVLLDPGSAPAGCVWRVSDGTRHSNKVSPLFLNSGTIQQREGTMVFILDYATAQTSQTISLQGALREGSGHNCDVVNNNTTYDDLLMTVEKIN